jgi:chromosome partitioning protein
LVRRIVGEVIACANQKGGVGKTTTVVSLAAYLAMDGRRVLVVDMDPQGNATSGVGVDRDRLDASVYDVLLADVEPLTAIVPTSIENLSLLPSDRSLAGAEVELVPVTGRERRLKRELDGLIEVFDFILLDCPPSLGLLTVNSLTAAQSVLIPLQCEYYALEGLADVLKTIELVKASANPDLKVDGIVLTMYSPNNLANQVADEIRRTFADQVFKTIIPRNVRLSEAPSHGKPILLYDVGSKGCQSYLELAREVERRLEGGVT